jgi:hypothetical protein
MIRKIVLIAPPLAGISVGLVAMAFYFYVHGDIPGGIGRHEVEYEKTLDIQPSYGRIRYASSMSRDPTYYYQLHLTPADFAATGIAQLGPIPNPEERRQGPSWWNPASDAQCFQSPAGRHGPNYYFYDPRRQLLFARCEM